MTLKISHMSCGGALNTSIMNLIIYYSIYKLLNYQKLRCQQHQLGIIKYGDIS